MAFSVHLVSSVEPEKTGNDSKDREIFGWAQHDDTTCWPNAAGALRSIESADEGQRTKDRVGLERSKSGGSGRSLLPRELPERRRRTASLFTLHKGLDRQRANRGTNKLRGELI